MFMETTGGGGGGGGRILDIYENISDQVLAWTLHGLNYCQTILSYSVQNEGCTSLHLASTFPRPGAQFFFNSY